MTLMRFLVARSMDVEKATKMFLQWHKWRAEFVPRGSIPESEVSDELNAEKIYLQKGPSRQGHPLLIIKVCRHFPAKDQPQFKSKLLLYYHFVLMWSFVFYVWSGIFYLIINNCINFLFAEFVVHLLDKTVCARYVYMSTMTCSHLHVLLAS